MRTQQKLDAAAVGCGTLIGTILRWALFAVVLTAAGYATLHVIGVV